MNCLECCITNLDELICVWRFLNKNDSRFIPENWIAHLYLRTQSDLMFSEMKFGGGCWRFGSHFFFFGYWLYHLLHAGLLFQKSHFQPYFYMVRSVLFYNHLLIFG